MISTDRARQPWHKDGHDELDAKAPDSIGRFFSQPLRMRVVHGDYCRSLIGGAVFSAGAGGSAVGAPDFFASASGRAGSGAGVVGRSPPGFGSAGSSFF